MLCATAWRKAIVTTNKNALRKTISLDNDDFFVQESSCTSQMSYEMG